MRISRFIACLVAVPFLAPVTFARDATTIFGNYERSCVEVSYGPNYKEYMNQSMQISKEFVITKATVFSDNRCTVAIRERVAEASVQSITETNGNSWKIASKLEYVLLTPFTSGDAAGLKQQLCNLNFEVNTPLDASMCLKIKGKIEDRRYKLSQQELTVGTSKYKRVVQDG